MRSTIHTLFACALAVSGVLAAGCDEPGRDPNDPRRDGSIPQQDAGPTTDTDGGGTTDTDGGTTPTTGDCAAQATAYCTRYEECNPVGFVMGYETHAICQRVMEAACADPATSGIPLSNGLTDEDACRESQVASCDGFLNATSAPIPDACTPLPGQVTEIEGACFTDAQCGMGTVPSGDMRRMYCRPLNSGGVPTWGSAECPRGACIPAKPLGSTCNPANQNRSEFCDSYADQACAKEFDMNDGAVGTDQCRQIEYGTTGAQCFPGTDKQCASGFRCDTVNRTCMAVLAEGQTCITGRDLCDTRRNLFCQDLGHGEVCAGLQVAKVGQQCGEVTIGDRTVIRGCSAYAHCDESLTPSVCVAKAALGETCTQDPDNCEPTLECDDTTDVCVKPDLESPTCP